MQHINKITQPFPEILALCYFGEGSACPGMPEKNPNKYYMIKLKLNHGLSNYMQRMKIIPQSLCEIKV